MRGIAARVLADHSCMSMTCPLVSRAAACTIASVLAPFQSCESTSQMIWVRPYLAATVRTVELVSPYGGRNSFGVPPPAFAMACWVREISESICAWPSWVRCGWV
jgi:hypothetical protein